MHNSEGQGTNYRLLSLLEFGEQQWRDVLYMYV